VTPYYAEAPRLVYTVPAHPPLTSISVAWSYLFTGWVDEHSTLLLWPAFYASLLLGFLAFARSIVSHSWAAWLTATFALIASGLAHVAGSDPGFADLPLATFLLAGGGLIWRWSRWPGLASAAVSGALLAGAGLTKEEGMVAAVVSIAAAPVCLFASAGWRHTPSRWVLMRMGCALAILALFVAPWVAVRLFYPVPETFVHAPSSAPIFAQRFVGSAVGLLVRTLDPRRVGCVLVLTAVWLVLRRSQRQPILLGGPFLYCACVVSTQLAIDAVGLGLSPQDLSSAIPQAAGRLILQVQPLAFLGVLQFWPPLAALVLKGGSKSGEEAGYT